MAIPATPADDDVMPDGPLKNCVNVSPKTFANTKKLTSLNATTGAVGCLRIAGAMEWTGAEFLPNLTNLYLAATPGTTLPEEGLTAWFPQLTTVNLTTVAPGTGEGLGDVSKLTSLTWQRSDLTTPPDLTGADELTYLSLFGNPITDVSVIRDLPKLASLNLTQSSLTDLSSVADLPALTKLDVLNGSLTSLSFGPGLPKLAEINAPNNQISRIATLPSGLTLLDLTGNQLPRATGISDLPELGTLRLAGNPLTDVSGLHDLPRLGSLSLDNGQLQELALGSGLTALTSLSVVNNQVRSVADLSGLTALTTLTLTGNQLTELPTRLPPALRALTVDGNQLTTVPSGLGLSNLTSLNLADNDISSIGDLSGLTTLTTLTLSKNKLTSFPARLPAGLGSLTLDNNLLTAVPDLAQRQLTTLELSANQIDAVGDLTGLDRLSQLNLSSNALTVFPARLPASLTTLRLDSNRIAELPETLDTPGLTTLSANSNLITVLRIPTPSLTTLNLTGNKLFDLSAIDTSYPTGMRLTATDQVVVPGPIPAAQAQPLAGLLRLPQSVVPTWTAGADNMAAINVAAGTFTAANAGDWALSFTATATQNGGRITYRGEVRGTAVGADRITIALSDVAVGEGGTAVFVPEFTGLDPSQVSYQWYRGKSATTQQVIAGATGPTLELAGVGLADAGAYIKVVVTTGDGGFHSNVVMLKVRPTIVDPGMAACLTDQYGAAFTTTDLLSVPGSLDCSGRGISSLIDLALIGVDVPVDLSGNLISDVAPLAALRTRRTPVDLSSNLISDLSPYAGAQVRATVTLDGNRIADLSPLATARDLRSVKTGPLFLIRDQRIGLPGITADTTLALPRAVLMDGTAAELSLAGEVVATDTVVFATAGLHSLTWDATAETPPVVFSGAFGVPVDVADAQLTTTTTSVTGGHPVTVWATGFAPDSEVTVSWGADPAGGGRTDASGAVGLMLTAPYLSGPVLLQVADAAGASARLEFTVTDDQVIDMPDAALLACVNQALRLPSDAIPYATRLAELPARNGQTLKCNGRGIIDPRGIEALPATSIDLSGNLITSIDHLSTLHPATSQLNLAGNRLTQVRTLAPQPNLTGWLNLSGNQIADFTGLDPALFGSQARVEAAGQEILYPYQFVGRPMPEIVLPGSGGAPADLVYPTGIVPSEGLVRWPETGSFTIAFTQVNGSVRMSGTISVVVLDQGASQITVNPAKAFPTWTVRIVASGFSPGELVAVRLDPVDLEIATVAADHLGVISIDAFVLPATLAAGEYQVTAVGADATARTPLTIHAYPTDGGTDPDEGGWVPGQTVAGQVVTSTAVTAADSFAAPRLLVSRVPLAEVPEPTGNEPEPVPPAAAEPAPAAPDPVPSAPQPTPTGTPWLFFGSLFIAMLAAGVIANRLALRRKA